MSMSGDLRTMPFGEVLAFVGNRLDGGIISVESRQRRKQVRVSCGRVVTCTTGGVKERLGQRLIAGGRITESMLIVALAEQDAVGGRLGEILVRRKQVADSELSRELVEQGRDALTDLFTWEAGSFTYSPSDAPVDLAVTMDMPCQDVLQRGAGRAAVWGRIRALLPDPSASFRVDASRLPAGFPRSDLEGAVITHALAGLGTTEICFNRHEDDFTIQASVARLVAAGALIPTPTTIVAAPRASADVLRHSDDLVKRGRWDRALQALLDAMAEHGEGHGLAVAAVRLRVKAREKLSWAGGLDVVATLGPDLQEQGLSLLDGVERVVAARVNGSRPLRAIMRGCPVDEDIALASFAGLFERGLLQLRHAPATRATEPVVAAAASPIPATRRSRDWEPPPSNRDAPRR